MPLNLQLAIQGGGAKIVALMATMEAIDDLQQSGKLRVTRIAGTSAGAMVGAIYSAGPKAIEKARIRLQSLSAKQIRHLFPSPFSRKGLRLANMVLWGNPLWSTLEIEEFLSDQLKNGSASFHQIGHLNHPSAREIALKVVATNLSSSKKEIHEGDDLLVPSLLNSAGLPYCFRTWTKSGSPVIVDGGICENLPSDELDQPEDVKKFGRVVGISFKPGGGSRIDSIANFSVSLLETAMQNSMQRARQRLSGDYLFDIRTTIGTFEFEKALERLREDRGEYDLIRSDAKKWFEEFVDRETKAQLEGARVLVGDPWGSQGLSMMDKLGEVYKVHHANRRRETSFCSLVVRARCLAKKDSDDSGQPDIVKYASEFKPKSEPIFCQRIHVSGTLHESHTDRTQWAIRDLTQPERRFRMIDLPIRTIGAQPGKDRELLLFLDPPLAPESGPYRFEFTDLVTGFMKPLSEGQPDDLFVLTSPSQGVIGQIDLVLMVPAGAPFVKITGRNGSPGNQMSSEELKRYEVPIGYRAMGWTAKNVVGGTEVRADLSFL